MTAHMVDTHPAWCAAEPCAAVHGGEHQGSPRIVPGAGPLNFTIVDLVQMDGLEPMLRLRHGRLELRYTVRGAAKLEQVLGELLAQHRRNEET